MFFKALGYLAVISTFGRLGGVEAVVMFRRTVEQRQELNFGRWDQPF